MATLITRLYETAAKAESAAKAAREAGVPAHDVDVVTTGSEITGAGLTADEAGRYAGRVDGGNAMAVVRAPFGMAIKATKALDSVDAIDNGFSRSTTTTESLSESFDKDKLIIRGNKRFLSSASQLPVVHETFSERFGMKLLSEHKRSNSIMSGAWKAFPWQGILHRQSGKKPSVSESKPSISGMLGWKTTTKPRKVHLNTDNPTPFSTMMNWRTVIRREVR